MKSSSRRGSHSILPFTGAGNAKMASRPNGFLLVESLCALMIVILCACLLLSAAFALRRGSQVKAEKEIDRTYFFQNPEEES